MASRTRSFGYLTWGELFLVCTVLLSTWGCAYFNTFYNAKRLFNQAEKNRKKVEKEALSDRDKQNLRRSYRKAYEEVVRKASAVLEFYPNSKWVDDSLMLLGKSFYFQSEYLKGARKFEELQVNFPDSKFAQEAQYWQGLCYWKSGRYGDAKVLLRKASNREDFKLADDALFALGEMNFENEDYIAALEEYKEALSRFKKSDIKDKLWQRIGKVNIILDRPNEVIDAFRMVLKQNPDSNTEYEARLKIGELFESQGRYEDALKIYQEFIKDKTFGGYKTRTLLRIARCYDNLGDTSSALNLYQKITDEGTKTDESAEALYLMATIYQREWNDLEKSVELLESAEKEARSEEIRTLAQNRLRVIGQLEEYQKGAADTTDSAARSLFMMAELYRYRLGQIDAALALYHKVTERFPQSDLAPKAAYCVGWIKKEVQNDTLVWKETLEEILEKYPKTEYAEAAKEHLGLSESEDGKSDKAKVIFLEAESLLFGKGEPNDYISKFEEIISNHPQSEYASKASYAAAWAYENVLKDSASAYQLYGQLVEKFPKTEYASIAQRKLKFKADGVKELFVPGADSVATDTSSLKEDMHLSADQEDTLPSDIEEHQMEDEEWWQEDEQWRQDKGEDGKYVVEEGGEYN